VGVPLANFGLKRRRFRQKLLDPFFLRGILATDQEAEPAGRMTTHSANIDTLAFHLSQIGLA
jgi:hypothetical protein